MVQAGIGYRRYAGMEGLCTCGFALADGDVVFFSYAFLLLCQGIVAGMNQLFPSFRRRSGDKFAACSVAVMKDRAMFFSQVTRCYRLPDYAVQLICSLQSTRHDLKG